MNFYGIPIFQSDRYGLVGYKVRVPNGNYDVKLMFAEKYFNHSDGRKFDINVELNQVITDLDIYKQVGMNVAYIKEIKNVNVSDGILDIHLRDKIDNALICGIVITPVTTGLNEDESNIIRDFKVEQNYPNPFNGSTTIKYHLNTADNVRFQLYNILGKQIFLDDLGFVPKGTHQYLLNSENIDSKSLSSGVYFYVFTTSQKREIRKTVLLN